MNSIELFKEPDPSLFPDIQQMVMQTEISRGSSEFYPGLYWVEYTKIAGKPNFIFDEIESSDGIKRNWLFRYQKYSNKKTFNFHLFNTDFEIKSGSALSFLFENKELMYLIYRNGKFEVDIYDLKKLVENTIDKIEFAGNSKIIHLHIKNKSERFFFRWLSWRIWDESKKSDTK